MYKSIELIGIPGSGKSYIYNLLEQSLKSRGTKVYNSRTILQSEAAKFLDIGIFRKTRYFLESYSRKRIMHLSNWIRDILFSGFLEANSDYVNYCRHIINKNIRSIELRSKLNRWLIEELAGWYLYTQLTESDNSLDFVYLNDEDFLHRALPYSAYGIDPHLFNLDKYCELCPVHDLLIHVNAATETCLARRLLEKDMF